MGTSLEESEKLVRIDNIHTNTLHLVKKNLENPSSKSSDSLAELKKETEGNSPVGRAG